MQWLLLIPLVYLAAVAQTSLVEVIRIGRIEPDLLAVTAMTWICLADRRWSFQAAGGVGLAADLISPGRIGLGMAAFLLVGYAVCRLRERIATDRLWLQLLVVAAGTLAVCVVQVLGHWAIGESGPLGESLLRALGVGLYSAAISLPILMIIGWAREPWQARRRRLRGF